MGCYVNRFSGRGTVLGWLVSAPEYFPDLDVEEGA